MDAYLEERADAMLHEIKEKTDKVGELERQAEAEMAATRERYEAELGLLKNQLVDLDKEIGWQLLQPIRVLERSRALRHGGHRRCGTVQAAPRSTSPIS